MKTRLLKCLAIFSLFLFYLNCGDNITQAPGTSGVGSPQNLKAFSRSATSVGLTWAAPADLTDSTFLGYQITWGNKRDTVPPSVLSYEVDSLPAGETLFNVASRVAGASPGTPASIRWAPAARFDSSFELTEYYIADPARMAGLSVGGAQSDPQALAVSIDATTMDFFLFGGSATPEEDLELRSANLYLGSLNQTFFSTVTSSSPSLDYALGSFPALSTFTESSIPVQANTIYYARVVGDQISGPMITVRIHVGAIISNGIRDRSVLITLSLQRVPGLLFAGAVESGNRDRPVTLPGRGLNIVS